MAPQPETQTSALRSAPRPTTLAPLPGASGAKTSGSGLSRSLYRPTRTAHCRRAIGRGRSHDARTIDGVNQSGHNDSGNELDRVAEAGETPAMSTRDQKPRHLRRIDPSQNMRRFYVLSLQPTLFGGASVVRSWGRIGTFGQSMMETFDHLDAANDAMIQLEKSKRRRGYRDTDI